MPGFSRRFPPAPCCSPENCHDHPHLPARRRGCTVGIYNEAAAALPKFKPATLDEIRRRCRASDFDAATRFFALDNGRPVGYASFHANGRVSYPWCRSGCEAHAVPLLESVLRAMRDRGIQKAFAAYRGDWQPTRDFFLAQGSPRSADGQFRHRFRRVAHALGAPAPQLAADRRRSAGCVRPLPASGAWTTLLGWNGTCSTIPTSVRTVSSLCGAVATAARWPSAS
jgi:hypothetical protein